MSNVRDRADGASLTGTVPSGYSDFMRFGLKSAAIGWIVLGFSAEASAQAEAPCSVQLKPAPFSELKEAVRTKSSRNSIRRLLLDRYGLPENCLGSETLRAHAAVELSRNVVTIGVRSDPAKVRTSDVRPGDGKSLRLSEAAEHAQSPESLTSPNLERLHALQMRKVVGLPVEAGYATMGVGSFLSSRSAVTSACNVVGCTQLQLEALLGRLGDPKVRGVALGLTAAGAIYALVQEDEAPSFLPDWAAALWPASGLGWLKASLGALLCACLGGAAVGLFAYVRQKKKANVDGVRALGKEYG